MSPTGPTGNQGDTCAPFLSPAVTFLQGVLLIFLVCCCSQLSETHQRKGKGSKARGTPELWKVNTARICSSRRVYM